MGTFGDFTSSPVACFSYLFFWKKCRLTFILMIAQPAGTKISASDSLMASSSREEGSRDTAKVFSPGKLYFCWSNKHWTHLFSTCNRSFPRYLFSLKKIIIWTLPLQLYFVPWQKRKTQPPCNPFNFSTTVLCFFYYLVPWFSTPIMQELWLGIFFPSKTVQLLYVAAGIVQWGTKPLCLNLQSHRHWAPPNEQAQCSVTHNLVLPNLIWAHKVEKWTSQVLLSYRKVKPCLILGLPSSQEKV